MNLLLLLMLELLLAPSFVWSADLQTFTCGDNSTPKTNNNGDVKNQHLFGQLKNPKVKAALVGHQIYYTLEFTPSTTINDANYTDLLYSTLVVRWRYMTSDPVEESFRLCNYVHPAFDNFTLSSNYKDLIENSSLFNYPQFTNSTSGAIPFSNSSSLCPLIPGNRYNIYFVTNIPQIKYMGSYETRFTIHDSAYTYNNKEDSSGCVLVYPTLSHPSKITYSISFGIITIFLLGFIASFYILNFSAHQETTNILLIVASSICNEPLLNELTPDIVIFLRFLQFTLFLTGLNLNYPGFLQPIMTYTNWVALIRIDIFNKNFIDFYSKDGIYQTLGIMGLFGLFPQGDQQPGGGTISHMWNNFIIWFWCSIAILIILSQFFLSFKQNILRDCEKIVSYKSRFYFAVGIVIQFSYSYFPLPFITLAFFSIYGLARNQPIEVSSAILAILFMVVWLVGICWFVFYVIIKNKDSLYSSFKIISCWSSIYYYYKPTCSYFAIIEFLKIIVEGFIIGVCQGNGTVQVSLLAFFELVYLLALLYLQPYFNKVRNIWCCSLSLISIIIIFLSVTYVTELEIDIYYRSIVCFIELALIFSVCLAFFISFIYRVISVIRLRRKEGFIPISKNSNDSDDNHDEDYEFFKDSEDKSDLFDFELPKSDSDYIPMISKNSESNSFSFDVEQKPSTSYHYKQYNENSKFTGHYSLRILPPPAVSPVDDEYLAKMGQNEDKEVRNLWKKRRISKMRGLDKIRKLSNVSSIDYSRFDLFKKNFVGDVVAEKGFVVVGRKNVVVKEEENKDCKALIQKPLKSKNKNLKNEFVVVGRKPIIVKTNTTAR